MSEAATAKPNATDIISAAWKNLQARRKTWTMIGLLTLAPTLLADLAAMNSDDPASNFQWTGFVIGAFGVFTLVFLAYQLVLYVMQTMVSLHLTAGGNELTFNEALKMSLTKLWPIVWTTILTVIAIIGGLILLIVPGILFAIWFGLSSYVAAEGKLTGVEAMKESKRIMTGNIGTLLLVGLAMLAIFIGVMVVTTVLTGGNLNSSDPADSNLVSVIATNIVGAGLSVFGLAVGATVYHVFKKTK